MRSPIEDFQELRNNINAYLLEYLYEHGINVKTGQNFKCINPAHNDKDPSMHYYEESNSCWCFSCHSRVDIFTAAHFLENKPIKGAGFVEKNVKYLAKKYNIPIKLKELTPEELYEYRTYEAYNLASEIISDRNIGNYTKSDIEIERRGWDKNKIASWGIGTINVKDLKNILKQHGYEISFLDAIDLTRPKLFNEDNLIFTIYDDHGRPVGFSSKNLEYNKDDKTSKTYVNTKTTGLQCAIFKKGERLYGYDIAKDTQDYIYIFEGVADVVTARHNGILNCCATLGTAFTDYHVNLLKKYSSLDICLCFDGDSAGEKATKKALDEKFAEHLDFNIKICQIPNELDPDDFIRLEGIDAFHNLHHKTSFEWRLLQFQEYLEDEGIDDDDEQRKEIANKMTPIIAKERNFFKQENMAKKVAEATGYDIKTIINEVKRLRNEREYDLQRKKKSLVQGLLADINRHPDNIQMLLEQCRIEINSLDKKCNLSNEETSTFDRLKTIKEFDDAKTGEFAGYNMNYLQPFAEKMNDDWKTGCMWFIGGSSQSGKSSMAIQIAYEIANNPDNNVMCIYHSIDDAAKYMFYKLIALASNSLDLTIDHIRNPHYYKSQDYYQQMLEVRHRAYKNIASLIRDHKIIIKDASDGPSLSYALSVVNYYKELYPERNIVLFIDNFHKLPDNGHADNRTKCQLNSNRIKNATVSENISIISTVEYRKLQAGELPSNAALKETGSLEYDATGIVHLYNDVHTNGEDKAKYVHIDKNNKILPRIRVDFGKNKLTGWTGTMFFDLFPFNSQFRHVDTITVKKNFEERVSIVEEHNKNFRK